MNNSSAKSPSAPDLRCYYHPDREATSQCDRCGDYLCAECVEECGQELLCNRCRNGLVLRNRLAGMAPFAITLGEVLKYAGLFAAFWFGFVVFQELVQHLRFGPEPLPRLWNELGISFFPPLLAAAIVSFFALHDSLRRARSPDSAWIPCGASGGFLFGSATVSTVAALFWITDHGAMSSALAEKDGYLALVAVLPVWFVLGLLQGCAVRLSSLRMWWMVFLPPVCYVLAVGVLSECLTDSRLGFPVCYPTPEKLAVAFLALGAVTGIFGWIERRSQRRLQTTLDLLFVGTWLIAAAGNVGLILPFHYLGLVDERLSPVRVGAIIFVLFAWGCAIALRLLIHYRRRGR